jgi:hypothetical protein
VYIYDDGLMIMAILMVSGTVLYEEVLNLSCMIKLNFY